MPINPIPGQPTLRPMFRSLGIAASGIAAQRQRMEVIAQNIANAEVTRGPDGAPYKRRDLVLEAATSQNALFDASSPAALGAGAGVDNVSRNGTYEAAAMDARKTIEVPVLPITGATQGPLGGEFGVRVAGVAEDQGEGRLMYEPGHPDADANGFVRYPDINTSQELVKLLDAKRIYEANAAVFQTAKSMLRAAIDI